MPSALLLLVYALAVARLTKLINADRITQTPREAFIGWAWRRSYGGDPEWASNARSNGAEPPLLVYLVECPWCVSVYIGLVAAPLVYWLGESPWLVVPALALALSHFTGFLASQED